MQFLPPGYLVDSDWLCGSPSPPHPCIGDRVILGSDLKGKGLEAVEYNQDNMTIKSIIFFP